MTQLLTTTPFDKLNELDNPASTAWGTLSGGAAPVAAWNAPSSMANRVAIFAPFGGFCWMTDPPSKWAPDPVGRTPAEARDVAWLMTCTARGGSPQSIIEAANTLAFATHLQREGSIARNMYKRLATRSSELVTISELENELRGSMEPVTVVDRGHSQRIDPYFWSTLDKIIRDSVTEYLEGLDVTLSQMKGLESLQLSGQLNTAMDRVRKATSHELSRVLTSRGTCADVVKTLSALRDEFCKQHVDTVKDHMRNQIKSLRALSWLATCDAYDIEQNLLSVQSELEMIIRYPPTFFVEYLESRGSSLLELSACYGSRGPGLVDHSSTVKPPSSGVRATMIGRWLNQRGALVREACASCIGVFNRLVDQAPTSMCWNGIELCRDDAADPRTRAALTGKAFHSVCPGTIVAHKPPKHLDCTGTPDARVLVYTQTDTVVGLRCVRFFSVLLEQAALGLLPPLTIQAGVLLPLVSRFTAEHEAQHVRAVELNLRPVATQCDHPWPSDEHSLRRKRHMTSSPVPLSTSASEDEDPAPAAAVPSQMGGSHLLLPRTMRPGGSTLALLEQENVPTKLLRDHAIVYALCRCMQERLQSFIHVTGYSYRIGLDQVCTMVRAVAPALASQKEGSLKQAVSYVIKTLLSRATAEGPDRGSYPQRVDGEFTYVADRDRKAGGAVVGLLMDAVAKVNLLKFAKWVAMQMSLNGAAYIKEWKPSRSAQSHATTVARGMCELQGIQKIQKSQGSQGLQGSKRVQEGCSKRVKSMVTAVPVSSSSM